MSLDCPMCSKENPVSAVVCWNCYTPLEGWDDNARNRVRAMRVRKNRAPWIALLGGGVLLCYGFTRRTPRGLVAISMGGCLAFVYARRVQRSNPILEEAAKFFDSNDDIAQNQTVEVPPIIRIANIILNYAIKDKAQEIHIVPEEKGVHVLFKADGVLNEQMKVPYYILAPLTERLKVMSSMDVRKRRKPQTGRLRFTMAGEKYATRISISPTKFGDTVVLRFE